MANGLSYATHVNSLLWHKVFLTGGRSVIHHGCWRTQYAVHMSKYMKSWDDLSPNNLQSSYPNEFQRITINHILLIIRNYPPFTIAYYPSHKIYYHKFLYSIQNNYTTSPPPQTLIVIIHPSKCNFLSIFAAFHPFLPTPILFQYATKQQCRK